MTTIRYQVDVTAPDADMCDRVITARVFHDEELLNEKGEPFDYMIDLPDGMSPENRLPEELLNAAPDLLNAAQAYRLAYINHLRGAENQHRAEVDALWEQLRSAIVKATGATV